jgi:hypothetical protein
MITYDPINSNLYGGDAAKAVEKFDDLMKRGSDLQNKAAAEYNSKSLQGWHWDFWTASFAATTALVSGLFSAADKSDQAKYVSIGSSLIVTASLGIKAAAQIGSRLTEADIAYSKRKGIIDQASQTFKDLESDLRSADAAKQSSAVSQLQSLNVYLESNLK